MRSVDESLLPKRGEGLSTLLAGIVHQVFIFEIKQTFNN